MNLLSRATWSAYLAWQLYGQAYIPFRSVDTVRRAQKRRLRAMLRHAYQTVPYYRETMARLGLYPSDFHHADDLAKLPLIQSEQLQRDPDYFTSTAQPHGRYVRLQTGGSTGDPRTVYHATAGILQNAAHGERDRAPYLPLIGRRYGYRETVLISINSTAATLQAFARSHAFLPPSVIRRQYLSLHDLPEKNIALMNEYQPDVLHTYGSYLGILFSYLAETGAPFHKPKVVTYSSDSLSDSTRRLIQDRFGIPVFSAYQANEALKIGFECEHHTGLHINIDLYPLRVVDPAGRDLPVGETGSVVVSNLVNEGTVLLNYQIGDLAALLPQPCTCGRTLPLLSFPPGRSDDLIHLPSGRVIHPQTVRTIFTTEEKVWQYQIVQDAPTHFTVKVIAAQDLDRPALERRVVARFVERFGDEMRVDLAFVDSIDRTRTGKFRPVISLCRGVAQPGKPAGGDMPDGR